MSTPQQQRVTKLLSALFDYDQKHISTFSGAVRRANELRYPASLDREMNLSNIRFILDKREPLLAAIPQASEEMLSYMEKDLLSTLQYIGYTNTNQSDNPLEYIDPDGRSGSFPDGSPEQNLQWEKNHGIGTWVRVGTFKETYENTPVSDSSYAHNGEDWHYKVNGKNETSGTPVYATESGTVASVGNDQKNPKGKDPKAKGNWVRVLSPDGGLVDYYHLSDVSVKKGDSVVAGTLVGSAGNTGASTGPHLHTDKYFITKPSDYDSNPDKYLKKTYDNGQSYVYFINPTDLN